MLARGGVAMSTHVDERRTGGPLNGRPAGGEHPSLGRRRRWLLALDPVFEAGRKGKRALAWDVEDELIAVALLGDVTIDLSDTRSAPVEIGIDAYAIVRDVDVLVGPRVRVELSGGVVKGDLRNDVPPVRADDCDHIVRIHGHALLGDVTVRLSPSQEADSQR
jgi:hypothetical protein